MARRPKKPPAWAPEPPEESLTVLKKELRRRGMSDAEVDATVRKKHRRKTLESSLVHTRHMLPVRPGPVTPRERKAGQRPRPRESTHPPGEDLCTVAFAARRLGLHPKTILRFIRDGRLRAKRIGKSYRILRTDLETFAGVPHAAFRPAEAARVTSILDVPGVGPELAQKWARTVTGALATNVARESGLRAEVVYDAERSELKVVVRGSPGDTAKLMVAMQLWLEQLQPD